MRYQLRYIRMCSGTVRAECENKPYLHCARRSKSAVQRAPRRGRRAPKWNCTGVIFKQGIAYRRPNLRPAVEKPVSWGFVGSPTSV